jgi:hypothetical protein
VTNYTAPKFHYLAGAQNVDTGLSRSEPSDRGMLVTVGVRRLAAVG